ncbi:MAG: GvpL/GvpF family gas vesicle protein [Victivallales bacterium]|nr:GvpL/GvpF family gas vesicle protein [Victivallales bacterium]
MTVSSKIYVYCIIDSDSINLISLPDGFDGNPVYCIPVHDIGIVVSDFSGKISDVKKGVLLHEKVIETLMNSYTVLPMRFQTAFRNRENALSALSKMYNNFKDNLARLSGKIEFGVKIIWPADKIKKNIEKKYIASDSNTIPGMSPAKEYLKEKFKNYKLNEIFKKKAGVLVAEIDKYFTEIALEKKLKILQTDKLLVNAAYLVDKSHKSRIKNIFNQIKQDFDDLEFLFSGPWPAYNFIKMKKKDA